MTGRRGSSARARATIRIGLTGPIGCGKSTVAGWLGELGAVVIDADRVAREVTQPGDPALEAVLVAFGPRFALADGSLDRAALGRVVFADPEALARLESIVHPAVRARIIDAMNAAAESHAPAVVVEAIKLVEGGLSNLCDEVWLVTCGEAKQRDRLTERGLDSQQADQRITAQAGLRARIGPLATRVIETGGDPESTRARVLQAWSAALGGRGGEG